MSCYFIHVEQVGAAFFGLFGLAALGLFLDLLADASRGNGGLLFGAGEIGGRYAFLQQRLEQPGYQPIAPLKIQNKTVDQPSLP